MRFKFVAQDRSSSIVRYTDKPRHSVKHPHWVSSEPYNTYATFTREGSVEDWYDRIVDLSTHDWALDKDGLLIAVEKGTGHESNRH